MAQLPRFLLDGAEELTNPTMAFTFDDGILTDGDMELSGVANFNAPFLSLDGVNDFIALDGLATDLAGKATATRGSIQIRGKIPDVSSGTKVLVAFGDTNANEEIVLFLSSSQINFNVRIAGTTQWSFEQDAITLSDDDTVDIIVVQDGTEAKLYINGVDHTAITFDVTTDKTKWFVDTTGIDNGRIGCENFNSGSNANFSKIDVDIFRYFNRALTATEALYYSRSKPVENADRWGNETELITDSDNRDFANASEWTNVDFNSYNETNDLSVTATVQFQRCELPTNNAPMVNGQRYRIIFDLANIVQTFRIRDLADNQLSTALDVISSNGTGQVFEFVYAGSSGGLRVIAGESTSSGDFDNFSIHAIGCENEFDFTEGNGIYVLDKSSNGNIGTITGGTWYLDNGVLKSTAKFQQGTQSLLLPQRRIQLEGTLVSTNADHCLELFTHLQAGADLHIGIEAYEVLTGTADGNQANDLVDSSNPFGNVAIGDRVHNTTDDTWAQCTGIGSAPGEILLNWDAFPLGTEAYEVFVDSRSGGYMHDLSLAGDDGADAWQHAWLVADPISTDTRFYITIMKDLADTSVDNYIDALQMFVSLVDNGSFESTSDWGLGGSGLSIADGVAKFVFASSTLRMDQTLSVSAATMYEVYFQIVSYSGSPSLRLEDANITVDSILESTHNDQDFSAVGFFKIQFLSAPSSASNRQRFRIRSTGGTVHVDNVAVRAVTGLPDNFTYRISGDQDGFMPQSSLDNTIFNISAPSHRFRKSSLAGDHFFEEALAGLTASARYRMEIWARGKVGGETLRWGTQLFTDAGNKGAGIVSETLTVGFKRFVMHIDLGTVVSGNFVYGATIADEIIYVGRTLKFVKETLPPLVFEKGQSYPIHRPIKPRQIIQEAVGGAEMVTDVGTPEELFNLVFQRLSEDNYSGLVNGLKTWFEDSNINWGQNSFTYQDEDGVETTVRYLDNTFDMPDRIAKLFSTKLTLRKVIT